MSSSDHSPTPLNDEAFLAAFLDCSLEPAAFNHQGHVRAAWLLLQRHPPDQALRLTCDGIARLAARFGVPDKYHRTVTEALVRLMAGCGAGDASLSWPAFQQANPLLLGDARRLLARHYSEQRLHSPQAREHFMTPDLLPLPTCQTPSHPQR